MAPVLYDFKGLLTAPGLLARSPASCIEAENVLFDAPGVVRKRPGFSRQTGGTGGPVYKMLTSRALGSNVLVHYGSASSAVVLRYGDGSGALAALNAVDSGNITRPPETRMAACVIQRNHYLTSDEGVRRLESDIGSSSVRYAGMPRGQGIDVRDMNAATYSVLTGAPGTLLPDGYARAYRVTWHRKDADGIEMGGPPTTRTVIRNQTGSSGYGAAARDVTMRIPIPLEYGTTATALTTSYFWRLWGCRTFNAAGGEVGDDEMYLIAEAFLSAGDIAAGYASFTDNTPDTFLLTGPRLHTNAGNYPPGEEGIRQGLVNEDAGPPAANTIAAWQDCLWLGDLTWRPSFALTLASVGGTGLVAADTVTINGTVFTAVAGAPGAATQFTVVTGLATTQMNIEATARNFVACVNRNLSTVKAYYVALGTTLPGLIYFEATAMGTITAVSSRGGAFRPNLTSTVTSGAATQANGLAFSKPTRGDAVPPVNLFSVGPRDARVIRVEPFRDRLLVFTDYGIFQVTGRTFADFSVFPFDLGYRLLSREAVALCDDRIYAWCYEGLIEIDDGGVRPVSTPIEPTVQDIVKTVGFDTMSKLCFSVAYRQQHRVHFYYPEGDDYANLKGCSRWLVYDTRTQAWSTGRFTTKISGAEDNKSCGVVRLSDDRLVLGNWNSTGADAYLFLERLPWAASAFTDEARDASTAAVTSTIAMQYGFGDVSGAAAWRATSLHFDVGELSWRTAPSSLNVKWYTEWGFDGTTITPVTGQLLSRLEPKWTVRRGNRLKLRLVHSTSEYFGLIGISQDVVPAGRLPRTT